MLLSEYADVFAPGLYKGLTVTFQLRENARPRLFEARTVAYALTHKMSESLDQLPMLVKPPNGQHQMRLTEFAAIFV